mmetsp:Transcript_74829/g.148260  ORF Transcript_74829/g.148260 Transcript_74829/m.148260 type:complete len:129 (+) Transcript_74829:96-482(+)|eukprot:CAMPEP_0172666474 /NCGR_PEP_ID=MMETSP1074-20121228/7819_1 /TAXON_ID=2916 /ORGANISM="Ceratium fusus, Strain PA161109" /LENGTH=128 /DNA_ID=CAMNT_0013482849 /DNA_START=94 /DNA_END=480 /DNA_ORIENTATION=-
MEDDQSIADALVEFLGTFLVGFTANAMVQQQEVAVAQLSTRMAASELPSQEKEGGPGGVSGMCGGAAEAGHEERLYSCAERCEAAEIGTVDEEDGQWYYKEISAMQNKIRAMEQIIHASNQANGAAFL